MTFKYTLKRAISHYLVVCCTEFSGALIHYDGPNYCCYIVSIMR